MQQIRTWVPWPTYSTGPKCILNFKLIYPLTNLIHSIFSFDSHLCVEIPITFLRLVLQPYVSAGTKRMSESQFVLQFWFYLGEKQGHKVGSVLFVKEGEYTMIVVFSVHFTVQRDKSYLLFSDLQLTQTLWLFCQ